MSRQEGSGRPVFCASNQSIQTIAFTLLPPLLAQGLLDREHMRCLVDLIYERVCAVQVLRMRAPLWYTYPLPPMCVYVGLVPRWRLGLHVTPGVLRSVQASSDVLHHTCVLHPNAHSYWCCRCCFRVVIFLCVLVVCCLCCAVVVDCCLLAVQRQLVPTSKRAPRHRGAFAAPHAPVWHWRCCCFCGQ